MNLVDIDLAGLQTTQRVIDFFHKPRSSRVARVESRSCDDAGSREPSINSLFYVKKGDHWAVVIASQLLRHFLTTPGLRATPIRPLSQ